jgi:hypothetical protein
LEFDDYLGFLLEIDSLVSEFFKDYSLELAELLIKKATVSGRLKALAVEVLFFTSIFLFLTL